MTTYILNSGGLKRSVPDSQRYFAQLLSGLGPQPKLLWCFFATLPDDPAQRFDRYTQLFAPRMPQGVTPIHQNATVADFADQVAWADAIYIHGGHVSALQEALADYDLPGLFAGKRIGTNSASSILMSVAGYDCELREAVPGLGIFPFKFIAHYRSDFGADDPRGPIDWDEAYRTVQAFGDPSLPVHALEEGEFIVQETGAK